MIEHNDAVMVTFSKAQVRHCKTAHFLKQFGPDALPDGPELAAMMGEFQFLVEGYDDDPQEIYAIPEDSEVVTGIAIGYAGDPEAFSNEIRERDLAPRERKPQRDVVFGASWGKAF